MQYVFHMPFKYFFVIPRKTDLDLSLFPTLPREYTTVQLLIVLEDDLILFIFLLLVNFWALISSRHHFSISSMSSIIDLLLKLLLYIYCLAPDSY